jgi:hypothetical protein
MSSVNKAVFSFYNNENNLFKMVNWSSPKHAMHSFILSVQFAARYFNKIELITDSQSAIFFKKLDLPFTSIRTDFDDLKGYPSYLWALGKIKAYQLQEEPFIHIDFDVLLTKPLPEHFLKAAIGFQNLEDKQWFKDIYEAQYKYVRKEGKTLGLFNHKSAYNCGIYLCNNLDYNKAYCKNAFNFVDANLALMHKKFDGLFCVVFEQYIAASTALKMNIQPLFLSYPYTPQDFNNLGYVHLWGAKKQTAVAEKLNDVAKFLYPKNYNLLELNYPKN